MRNTAMNLNKLKTVELMDRPLAERHTVYQHFANCHPSLETYTHQRREDDNDVVNQVDVATTNHINSRIHGGV